MTVAEDKFHLRADSSRWRASSSHYINLSLQEGMPFGRELVILEALSV